MAHKAAFIAAGFLEFNVVESCLKVNETNVLVASEEPPVTPRLIELVLIFIRALVYWYDVLDHSEWLSRLPLRDK